MLVSDPNVEPVAIRTYSHIVKVPFELPRNFMGELTTCYRETFPSPVQGIDLPPYGQYAEIQQVE